MRRKIMKCVACDKDILEGNIFVMIRIDIRRLIYNNSEIEENFLVPYGPVHSVANLPLCEGCRPEGLMNLSPKDMAKVLSNIK
jgi:hypothetical protein